MPHLFEPLQLRGLTLRNRIGVPPMCQYSARDGYVTEWHQPHYVGLARGSAGLVIVDSSIGAGSAPAPAVPGASFSDDLRRDRVKAVGDFIAAIFRQSRAQAELDAATKAVGLAAVALDAAPSVKTHPARAARVAGMHYFMPAHLVPLVEIIKADFTDVKVCDWLEKNQRDLGKMPVRVNKDIPGFIGNRLQHAMMREALYLISDGVVSPEGVDAAVRYGFGFRFLACGPMMQKEMSGWDTNYYAATSLYPDLHADKKAAPVVQAMMDKGHLGMKTKQGMWSWDDEGIKKEKGRIEKVLQQAIAILNADMKK